ncbi:hypothetical protein ACNQKP_05380 [Bdellovibrio bacteriovorus]|uniref:hypothetical protein n=1 Tax=Bdellovibrio bacteriovorus TaxID=959 RepID=UPI003AA95C78
MRRTDSFSIKHLIKELLIALYLTALILVGAKIIDPPNLTAAQTITSLECKNETCKGGL